jgi:hypothetical protein
MDVYMDRHRNQLARVIENALCFQRGTPATLKQRSVKSRLYQYKFWEYSESLDQVVADLNASRLPRRNDAIFQYPVLSLLRHSQVERPPMITESFGMSTIAPGPKVVTSWLLRMVFGIVMINP